MAQMDDTGNVQPIRTIDDEAALAWLRAQPGGRTKLSDAELGHFRPPLACGWFGAILVESQGARQKAVGRVS